MSVPADLEKKWRAKLAAFRRAAKVVAEGYSDDVFMKMVKARDAIDRVQYEIGAYERHDSEAGKHRQAERDALVSSLWESSKEAGRAANLEGHHRAMKKLDEEIREAKRPYEWMYGAKR